MTGPTRELGRDYEGQKAYTMEDTAPCCGCAPLARVEVNPECECRCHETPRAFRRIP